MSAIYEKIIRPIVFGLPAETAHEFGAASLRIGLGSRSARDFVSRRLAASEFGELKRFGLTFSNPIGIAAGFDKNGRMVNQLASLGFGFVEVGTVTLEPQTGNPKPRLFRLPKDMALINRLGFNNDGALKIAGRLNAIRPACVVGVNIGRNRDVPNDEAIPNYLRCFDAVFDSADYISVNVSSPNTPNLRELQQPEELGKLIFSLQQRNAELSARPSDRGNSNKPLLVKISPDLSDAEIEAIVEICIKQKVAGLIAANTTIGREGLSTSGEVLKKIGAGGLSGKPVCLRSRAVISTIFRYSRGKLPIVGVGGIFTAEDAFAAIAAGACLIQAYTGFVYHGLTFARDINRGLAEILRSRGFRDLDEAIGSGA